MSIIDPSTGLPAQTKYNFDTEDLVKILSSQRAKMDMLNQQSMQLGLYVEFIVEHLLALTDAEGEPLLVIDVENFQPWAETRFAEIQAQLVEHQAAAETAAAEDTLSQLPQGMGTPINLEEQMAWSFIEHLTGHLAKPRMGDSKQPTLWPSEASAIITNQWGEEEVVGKCRRATFFRFAMANYAYDENFKHLETLIDELKAKSIPIEPYVYWLWSAGELYEEYIINMSKTSGVFIGTQIPIYMKEYNMSGKLDVVAINPETCKNTIIEAKSVYGHNGDRVLGSAFERRTGSMGVPRESNLMQIALYDWHYAKPRDDFEDSILLYGSRDTGRFAEYKVRTEKIGDDIKIFYSGQAPVTTAEIESPITVNSILDDGYAYVTNHLMAGVIPPRDFDAVYSEEKIQLLYKRDQDLPRKQQRLSKKDREQIEKIEARKDIDADRVANGKAPLKPLKKVTKGDWNCGYCRFKNVCFNEDNTPRDI